MKRWMKWFIVVLLVLFLGMQGETETIAAEEQILDEKEYVLSILPGYLYSIGIESINDVSVSDPIGSYDSEGNVIENIYLIFLQDKIVAELAVAKNESQFYSKLILDHIGLYQNLYDKNESIALIYNIQCRMLVEQSSGRIHVLEGDESDKITVQEVSQITDYEEINKEACILRATRASYSTVYRNVPFVSNTSVSENGIDWGLCWCASAASVVNYLKGTSYDAVDVFNEVMANDGINKTTNERIVMAHTLFAVPTVFVNNALTTSNVHLSLSANRPFTISLESVHAVVICGILNGDGLYYRIMDPNYSYYITVAVSSAAENDGSQFIYNVNGTARRWTKTFY